MEKQCKIVAYGTARQAGKYATCTVTQRRRMAVQYRACSQRYKQIINYKLVDTIETNPPPRNPPAITKRARLPPILLAVRSQHLNYNENTTK